MDMECMYGSTEKWSCQIIKQSLFHCIMVMYANMIVRVIKEEVFLAHLVRNMVKLWVWRKYYCTELLAGKKQGGIRKGKGCVDQIFALRQVVREALMRKRWCLWYLKDLAGEYDKVKKKGLGKFSIYSLYGRLMNVVKCVYNGKMCLCDNKW